MLNHNSKISFLKDLRGLGKDALIYGASSAVARMISIFTAPIMTRIFTPADYGVISLVQLAISFFVIIAGMNIGSGVSFYFFHFNDEKKKNEVLSTGILSIALLSISISLFLFLFAEQLAIFIKTYASDASSFESYNLSLYIRIAALGLFFSLMNSSFTVFFRIFRQPFKFMQVQLLLVILNVALILTIVVFAKKGVTGVFWAGTISAFLVFFIGLYYLRGNFTGGFSKVVFGLILAYSLPQLPGVFVNWGQSQIGRVFINYHVSLADLGLYSIAITISSVLVLATTAFRLAYDPYAMSIMKQEDAPRIYARFYDFYGVAFAFGVGAVAAFAKPILMLLTPPTYYAAHHLVIFFLTAEFFMGLNNIVGAGIWISRKTKYTSYAQLFSFVVLMAMNFLLVPTYGATGAAMAFLGGMVTQNLAYYYFAQKLWPVPYRLGKLNGLIAVVFLIGLAHSTLIDDLDTAQTIAAAFFTTGGVAIVCWNLGLSSGDRAAVKKRFLLKKC